MLFSRRVRVTLLDASTGEIIAAVKLRPDELPETIYQDTMMRLADTDWTVVRAAPTTRHEYTEARALVLTVAPVKIAMTESKRKLFSVPTINGGLPDEDGIADGTELVLTEDDWRQCELVHVQWGDRIDEELRAIRRIRETHGRGPGFGELHVRERIPDPLRRGRDADPIEAPEHETLGRPKFLSFRGHAGRISGGFGFDVGGGWVLYGTVTDGGLGLLCVRKSRGRISRAVAGVVEELARDQELVLIDWCAGHVGRPGESSFFETLDASARTEVRRS